MFSSSLPQAFLKKMSELLGEEYKDFLHAYNDNRTNGLRVNTLKTAPEEFRERQIFSLTPVPWCREGYYFDYSEMPGQHPYHPAGVYYIQEPSAMAVVEYLDPRPGEYILDLAAAPGGKATQIASRLKRKGLLWANEIDRRRARILLENLERWGVPNIIVSNESPRKLARTLKISFDKILVDAPCSGEGMFRRDPAGIKEWSPQQVKACSRRQQNILDSAAEMLKPGGYLVYSTCTFSPEENEYTLTCFLAKHPDFQLEPLPKLHPDFTESSLLPGTIRLYPHRIKGEGHFIALLRRKTGQPEEESPKKQSRFRGKPKDLAAEFTAEILKDFKEFAAVTLTQFPDCPGTFFHSTQDSIHFTVHNNHLFLDPLPELKTDGLNILRRGLYLGEKKAGRFLPGHALALSLKPENIRDYISFKPGDKQLESYLHGETLPLPGPDGWVIIGVDDYPLGWGKRTQGQIKNHYPKYLRK